MARSIRPLTLAAALILVLSVAACSASGRTSAPSLSNPNSRPQHGTATDGPRDGFAPEVRTADDPQSTFALDVDTASYSYSAAQITSGQLPAAGVVRQEEFINAFPQDYRPPTGNGFSVTVDGTRMPESFSTNGSGDIRLLRIGLQTRASDNAERRDVALTFVIDTSGSMGDPGKLDLVKGALHALVDQLRPADSVAIVTFNDRAEVVQTMTSVSHGTELHRAIDRLAADGSTNLEAGLVAGYDVARQGFRAGATNRVVILSDGLANTGDTSSDQILAEVREQADKQITLLGVGVGHDYGDALMESLADHGDGFVIYVSDPTQARQVFIDQLPATDAIRALDAKAQVTFDPRTVVSYRLIGYDDRAVADSSFRDDHVDGGEVVAGHTVTALYAVRLVPDATGPVATARVRWLDPAERSPDEAARSIDTADLAGQFTGASPYLQTGYAAGYFAEVLRGSPYGQQVRLGDLADIAARAADRTHNNQITDLAGLIRRADGLRR
jgi:Ca-activated chloride channel family protein